MNTDCQNYNACMGLIAIDLIANIGRSAHIVKTCDRCNAYIPKEEGGKE